jgi:probable phosphoglycerate mutase
MRHPGETIVVVSNGLVLDALYRRATDMPVEMPRGFPLLNCSVNTFRRTDDAWVVVDICDVGHLSEEEVTRFSDATVQQQSNASDAKL